MSTKNSGVTSTLNLYDLAASGQPPAVAGHAHNGVRAWTYTHVGYRIPEHGGVGQDDVQTCTLSLRAQNHAGGTILPGRQLDTWTSEAVNMLFMWRITLAWLHSAWHGRETVYRLCPSTWMYFARARFSAREPVIALTVF